jgi:hypothetical protein
MNTTQTAPLTLNASAMTRRLRAARLGVIRSYALADGALRVFAYGTDDARAIAAHLLQAGYDAAATGDRVTVTLPEPAEYDGPADDDECGQCGSPRSSARHTPLGHAFVEAPVIVRAGEAAPLAEQEAPRQDLAPAVVDTVVAGEPIATPRAVRRALEAAGVARGAVAVHDSPNLPATIVVRVLNPRAIRTGDDAHGALLDAGYAVELPEGAPGLHLVRQAPPVVEPGPEVDDSREQPAPVAWSEVATPSLPALDGRPRVLRYRQ